MTDQERIAKAQLLGKTASENGQPCVPALDSQLMEILYTKVGSNMNLLKAWHSGWTIANIND